MSVRKIYQTELAARGYSADPAQLRAVQVLQTCAQEWGQFREKRSNPLKKLINHPPVPQGIYLYGGVGRGKSFLMDCFYNALPLKRKTRLHFHEFMREVHRELAALRGTANPLDALAKSIALKYRLICFDEFHVSDITDAMILHRLLKALFENGVGLVTTSNYKPDDLYPNGLNRDRLLPAIAMINAQMQVLNVDHGTDYRVLALAQLQLYHHPLGPASEAALSHVFDRLAETLDQDPVLQIEARTIFACRRSGGVVWFDFKTLCGGPRSQNDYLELAAQFHTVVLSGVPQMSPRMASEARRFTWLVDVLYDRHVKLIVSAAVSASQLYPEGPLAHEFTRTVSRLNEMQSANYLALERRQVDTRLTA
ncbi:MAG: cell division protein ZapE [Rhodoferax sp.]|nr:cell division protein ZapE [Rhodoferax sp.]